MKLFGSSTYSLRKSTRIFHEAHRAYKRHRSQLSSDLRAEIEKQLTLLQQALAQKNRQSADAAAKQLQTFSSTLLKKSTWHHAKDFVSGIGFALLIAVLVRLVWFELYEIPTGSMRPTLREQDRLAVSKTNFGINIPLTTGHFYFDPALVQRSGIFVFTGENMDIPDVDTFYFYLFPGKKQYIKRLLGKPGDTLYFYGGKIYGIDQEGRNISGELDLKELALIDHIPYIHFERKVVTPRTPVNGVHTPAILYQMDEPVARLSYTGSQIVGEMLNPPEIHQMGVPSPKEYGQLWGFDNYATARLLTKEQANSFSLLFNVESAPFYLELTHHPSFEGAKLIRDEWGRVRPSLGTTVSLVPLTEQEMRRLFDNLYTARFCVQKGVAERHGAVGQTKNFAPLLSGVPDGCYEFYYGTLYEVKWQGIVREAPKDHPLYHYSAERTALLFNLGMEFDTRFLPTAASPLYLPSRYAYFRDGDLYVLGAPLLTKGDPRLIAFLEKESQKSHPFIDAGPPVHADGTLDTELIKKCGLVIPPRSYLALGDNHAMSSDSRDFGFVPEDNMRGAPDLILWPPGPRLGRPNQPPYPFLTQPRLVIWITAALCLSIGYLRYRRKTRTPLKFE